uniref:Uncharacterized protein n=1 Tax=Nothobranchius kuhntae TaxID=321403 RepID=A0A1A8J1E2_NOTKU
MLASQRGSFGKSHKAIPSEQRGLIRVGHHRLYGASWTTGLRQSRGQKSEEKKKEVPDNDDIRSGRWWISFSALLTAQTLDLSASGLTFSVESISVPVIL